MINKPVTLYLGRSPLPIYINVSQFDTMWAFQFSIIYAGQPWTIPSGANVILNGRKPDGNVFAFSGTVADNVATVNANVQMTAVAGLTECELSILASGKVVGTANFTLAVEAAPKSPSDISSESTLPAYAELLEVAAGLPDNIPQYITDWLDDHPEATTTVQDGAITPVKLNGAFLDALTIQKTVSGSVASFADGSVLPVKDITAQIVAQQSGSGDPSPSNIRPITGYDECAVYQTGLNMFSSEIIQGGISTTGGNNGATDRCKTGTYIVVAPNTTYTVSCVDGVDVVTVHFYTQANVGSWISKVTNNSSACTFTTPPNCKRIRVAFGYPDLTTDILPEAVTDTMLVFGTTAAADYKPYVGQTHTIDWQAEAGTVYGGELDVTTGLLTVTHGYMSFDGTENWGSFGSGDRRFFRLTIDGRRIAASSSRFCSHYRNVTVTTSDTAAGYYAYSGSAATGGYVQFRPENAAEMTKEEWKEWLAAQASAGTPVQVTWMWETPVTYQLTTTEVATLLGQNNLFASTGDISVIYRADPSLVIAALEARVAALEEA